MIRNLLLILLLWTHALNAQAAAVIFSGDSVRALKSKMSFQGVDAVLDFASGDISLEPASGRYVLAPSNVVNIGSTAPPSTNLDINLDNTGVLSMKERTSEPTADSGYGKVYPKDDDRLYFQDGAGGEHDLLASGLIVEQVFDFSSAASTMTTTTGDLRFGGNLNESGEGLVTYNDSTGVFTANRACKLVSLDFSARGGSAGGLQVVDGGGTNLAQIQTTTNAHSHIGANVDLDEGDSFKINAGITLTSGENQYLRIILQATDSAALTSQESNTSYVKVSADNGNGSTNTAIRRFSTTEVNTGTAITYADSATDGATFTINETGVYHIAYTADWNAANQTTGISVNSNQLTTDITGITNTHRLAWESSPSVNGGASATWIGPLVKDDIVRAHVGV